MVLDFYEGVNSERRSAFFLPIDLALFSENSSPNLLLEFTIPSLIEGVDIYARILFEACPSSTNCNRSW
jgi:hypothetical protein